MKKKLIKDIEALKKLLIMEIVYILDKKVDKRIKFNLKINNPDNYQYQYLDVKEIFRAKINNCIFLAANSEQFGDEVNLEYAYIEDLILIYKNITSL